MKDKEFVLYREVFDGILAKEKGEDKWGEIVCEAPHRLSFPEPNKAFMEDYGPFIVKCLNNRERIEKMLNEEEKP